MHMLGYFLLLPLVLRLQRNMINPFVFPDDMRPNISNPTTYESFDEEINETNYFMAIDEMLLYHNNNETKWEEMMKMGGP